MTAHENLESLLKRRTRFARLFHTTTCESTQDLACEPSTGEGDAVIWADHQTLGRGRHQRSWHDEPGLNVLATFRVRLHLEQPLAVPAAMPVAVLRACEPSIGCHLRIKWPNDVYHDQRKLAGVIVDRDSRRPDLWRIGIGVNVNCTRFPAELEDTATSLLRIARRPLDRTAVLLSLAEQVDKALQAIESGDVSSLEHVFARRLGLVGERVAVTTDTKSTGTLTAINFQRLQLDGDREVPLAIVRTLQRRDPPA